MSVRMGVIGTGRMAAAMLDAAARLPGLTIGAVASASGAADRAQRLSEAFGIADAYGEAEALLTRKDIDLVYIATETFSHARLSVAALDAGKSVLCEKPFATSLAEARAVAEAARRNNRLFVEAIWTLLLPAYRYAIEAARAGVIGDPAHLVASFGYPDSDTRSFPAKGGVLLDRAVYPVSLAVKLMGSVEKVNAALVRNADGIDVEARVQALHKGGGCSQLAASLSSLLSNEACVSGGRGSITLEAPLVGCEQVTIRHAKADAAAGVRTDVSPSRGARETLRAIPLLRRLHRRFADGRHQYRTYGANQYLPLLEHVVGLVASGKRESDMVPLDLSLEVARVIELARLACAPVPSRAEGAQ